MEQQYRTTRLLRPQRIDAASGRDGGIGRHGGLKIPFQQWNPGSSPGPGTSTLLPRASVSADQHLRRSRFHPADHERRVVAADAQGRDQVVGRRSVYRDQQAAARLRVEHDIAISGSTVLAMLSRSPA